MSTHHSSRHFWGCVSLAVVAAACDGGPVGPGPGMEPAFLSTEYTCAVNVRTGTTTCRETTVAPRAGGPLLDILPGEGSLTFVNSWSHSRGNAANEDTSTNTLAFTNNMGQAIGTTNGTSAHANGNRLFFTTAPHVTEVSSGTVSGASIQAVGADGTASFNNPEGTSPWPNKPYWQYNGIVGHGGTSGTRAIKFIYSANVTEFSYTFRVSTPVRYEYGWVVVTPGTSPVLHVGEPYPLYATAHSAYGVPLWDGVSWSSSNTGVATVNASTGEVTAVGAGVATITATSTANAQRIGSALVRVDARPAVTGTDPGGPIDPDAIPSDPISIGFSEAVNVTASTFELECPTGTAQTFTVSGSGTSSIVLNPDGNLPVGTCTVTVLASQVNDADADDGPDMMYTDYQFDFEVLPVATDDVFPHVISGSINTATLTPAFSVLSNDAIADSTVISFAGWEAVPDETWRGGSISMSSDGTFTYTPPSGFQGVDSVEYVLQHGPFLQVSGKVALTVDLPPAVTGKTPANGAVDVDPNTAIQITFNEAVSVSSSSFAVVCAGLPQDITHSVSSGGTVVTLTPANGWVSPSTCTVTVYASHVTDADANDGPNQMSANHQFSFDVGGFGGF